ncbi:MAG: transketolase [Deltaproteobacteria bacterium]|nr:transketolase [Deltaproteobacteria bacterium]
MSANQNYEQLASQAKLCINTLRFLAVDAIQKANSGHPGLPMGMAAIGYQLFTKHLKHNPKNPDWQNRDRFVLSAGHGSALLYSLLHLTGYDVSLDDLKNFRQIGSKTPGHPEYGDTAGVEATTGPLGQGLSNAVGMAIAEKYAASMFNQAQLELVNYKIYVLAGDGCFQEGVAAEASSLAGHLGLGNLIVIYDDNQITIDGSTGLSFTEDVLKRYESYNWHVQEVPGDGHDLSNFDAAIEKAQQETDRPSLIKLSTIIGFGSPNKEGTSGVHGSPLGEDEIKLAKERLGWEFQAAFHVPEAALKVYQECIAKGSDLEKKWETLKSDYTNQYPEQAKQFEALILGKLPENWEKQLPVFEAGSKIATRVASGKTLEAIMPGLPFFMGGSADLSPSNNTKFPGAEPFQKDNSAGRYLHFGVREHAMGAILNGISLSKTVRAYGATFMCFSDYMLPAIRVAALSSYPSVFVFTHDSIGLGEDGPTHQPVEHINYLRNMPGLTFFRPADANETAQAWKYIIEHSDRPVAIALTRQGLPVLDQEKYGSATQIDKGAYVLIDEAEAEALIIATGSEIELAVEAHDQLLTEGIKVKVISMPSAELFEQQAAGYKNEVLPSKIQARVAVEAGIRGSWDYYLGSKGQFVGMNRFGASAPANQLFEKFEITTAAVIQAVKKSIQ